MGITNMFLKRRMKIMKRFPDGRKNRLHPEKPVNWSSGCDPAHAGRPWCQDCTGSKKETFLCRKRSLHWLASLTENKRKKQLEFWGNAMCPDTYR